MTSIWSVDRAVRAPDSTSRDRPSGAGRQPHEGVSRLALPGPRRRGHAARARSSPREGGWRRRTAGGDRTVEEDWHANPARDPAGRVEATSLPDLQERLPGPYLSDRAGHGGPPPPGERDDHPGPGG